ncbi:ATP-binding cassette domain-containing protein [Streptomyces sp. NPDC055140]
MELINPQSGYMTWGGTPVQDLDRARLFKRFSQLTQDFPRWPFTAAMNVRIGRPHHAGTPEELDTSVQYATASPVIDKLPAGMDTLPARQFRRGGELSGGEWQKIGLARTHWRTQTCTAHGVLIVDEPTSALGPESETEAFDRIRDLTAPNRAVVLVTHRMSGVRRADLIYVLQKGQVI